VRKGRLEDQPRFEKFKTKKNGRTKHAEKRDRRHKTRKNRHLSSSYDDSL